MVKDESETQALRRRIDYLESCHLRQARQHREELASRNAQLQKRGKYIEKLEKAATKHQQEAKTLATDLRRVESTRELLELNVGHLKLEAKRLGAAERRIKELEEALKGNADAQLRLRIKQLLLAKYHPDRTAATTTLTTEDVAKDLTALLEQ